MNLWELLLLGLVLWTAIGLVGSVIALVRRDRLRARRGVLWLLAVWGVYLAAEFTVAKVQGQRVTPLGRAQCFDEMCFTATGTEEIPAFFGRNSVGGPAGSDGSRLLRVSVRVENRGHGGAESEALVRAYLVDKGGRRWDEVPGLSGVRLTVKVPGGGAVVSQPVFKVPTDAGPLGLVLTHGSWQPGRLVIGDGDSLGHEPQVMKLGP